MQLLAISSTNNVRNKITGAKGSADRILEDATRDAEALKNESLLEAKDENHRLRTETEREVRERRNELQKQENQIIAKRGEPRSKR